MQIALNLQIKDSLKGLSSFLLMVMVSFILKGQEPIPNNQREGHKHNVRISSIEINGKSVPVQSIPPYTLDPRKCSITIHWEIKGGQKDSISEFRYRLLGASNKWIKLSKDAESINFNQLQPGKYQFQIFALNFNGYGSEYFSGYHFNIQTDWYHSWWYYLGNLILLCFLFYYFAYRSFKEKIASIYLKVNHNNQSELE